MRKSISFIGVLSVLLIATLRSTSEAQTIFTVTNTNDSGPGSLRQAMLDANGSPGRDTIQFTIPGTGTQTIALLSALPTVADPVVIDGRTQPGFGTHGPVVELSGAGAGAGADGLHITAGSSEVWGLAIYGFQSLGSSGGNGIVLENQSGNSVDVCYIGTNAALTLPIGNQAAGILIVDSHFNAFGLKASPLVVSANGVGVHIVGMSFGNDFTAAIGGAGDFGNIGDGVTIDGGSGNTFDLCALIGNGRNGISIGPASQSNVILRSSIGAIGGGNRGNGIEITGSSLNSVTTSTINDNAGNGIVISGGLNNIMEFNRIGAGGTNSGNALAGLLLDHSSGNEFDQNAIGRNGEAGVLVLGGSGNIFRRNLVGMDVDGTSEPNGGDGITLMGGSIGNLIGPVSGAGNTVSANHGVGVRIADAGTTGNIVANNRIGTSPDGTQVLGNGSHGVSIENGASGNTIGGAAPGTGNTISFNGGSGIFVASGRNNALIGNSLSTNAMLGIDLAPSGVTPNDPGDGDSGANDLQNFPALSSAESVGTMTDVLGFLNSAPSTTYRIEFFSGRLCDPSGHGQGETFLGFTNVATDGSGIALIDAMLPVTATGSWITATATDPGGNTSEFSACVMLVGPSVTSIAPTSGPATGGTSVTIKGMRFLPGATVTMGGADASNPFTNDDTTVFAVSPPLPPGVLYDVSVTNPGGIPATLVRGWFADFTDVPAGVPIHDFVEKLLRHGVTAGCTPGNFCPDDAVSRAQVAVFLLRAHDGPAYTPPPATGTVFTDVPVGSFAAAWIEQLASRSITAGCGGGAYCPQTPVTREQMAVLILRTEHGPAYVPPDPTGVFSDVPVSSPFARWVERLAAEGITTGCGGGLFCPQAATTRANMAVFLVTAFGLN